MKFQINDMVQYGTNGICKVLGTEKKCVLKQEKTYFVLQPVFDQSALVFVPQDNEALLSKMRRLLNAREVRALLSDAAGIEDIWIEDRQQRMDTYRALLGRGDRIELLRMIRTLDKHEKQQQKKGKKLNMADERLYKAAQKALFDEFAFVLQIQPEEVAALVLPATAEERQSK